MVNPARVLIFILSLCLPFAIFSSPVFAENLLKNPGFEESLTFWNVYEERQNSSTFEATTSAAKSGNYSALITKLTSKSYTYFYQQIEATPSASYKLQAWVRWQDETIKNAKLRISWFDIDKNLIGSKKEIEAANRSSDFQKLELSATAPQTAAWCQVEGFVNLDSPNPVNPVLFDDFTFESVPVFSITASPPASITAGEDFLTSITVTHAKPDTIYRAKVLIGESSESSRMKSGHTAASSKYLAWNGSWNEMPTFKTDINGQAVFEIKANIYGSASGQHYLRVRARDPSSDENFDSDPYQIFVNASNSDPVVVGPQIDFSLEDSNLRIDQPFGVKLSISNLEPFTDYYIKIRLGQDASKLTKAKTHNSFGGSVWLSDSDRWDKFPVIYTDANGRFEGVISAKVSSGNEAGDYLTKVRIRDTKTEENIDSSSKNFYISEALIDEEGSQNSNNTGEVLGALTQLPLTGSSYLIYALVVFIAGLLLRYILWRLQPGDHSLKTQRQPFFGWLLSLPVRAFPPPRFQTIKRLTRPPTNLSIFLNILFFLFFYTVPFVKKMLNVNRYLLFLFYFCLPLRMNFIKHLHSAVRVESAM